MNEPLTSQEAQEEGFTDSEIQLLRDAGLLREDAKGEPWRPETIDDVDWVCWKARQLDAEIAAIQARAAASVLRLTRERSAFLRRYEAECQAIVQASLPRKADGSYRRKSLELLRVKVGLRSVAGGPRITDEAALLTHVRELAEQETLSPELAAAIKVTTSRTGFAALDELREQEQNGTPEACKVSLLATPVKGYLATLPATPDPDTGELRPTLLPGTELAPPEERFYWE